MREVSKVRRLLFIRTDRLGETLLNLPAIAALKRALPQASITLLAHPDLASLLAGSPVIDEVLAYQTASPGQWGVRAWELGRMLKPSRFDLAIVSNPKKELHAGVWLAGIPCRVGYGRKWGGLLTHRIEDRKALGERHEVEYNLDLLRVLGLPVADLQWPLPAFEQERVRVSQLLDELGVKSSDDLIAVHPWTSNPQKQWSVERYAALIRQFLAGSSSRVAVIGGPEEQSRAGRLALPSERAHDLVGRLTLRQLAVFFTRCRLLLSGDSGPVHLAAAVGTPTIVLFGTSDPATGPRRWGPWGTKHTVIWKPSMETLGVDEVWRAIERYLEP